MLTTPLALIFASLNSEGFEIHNEYRNKVPMLIEIIVMVDRFWNLPDLPFF
jgi:hypothetical protein